MNEKIKRDFLAILDEELPASADIEALLASIDAPKCIEDIGMDKSILPMTLMATKDIRDKYILSRLLWDLGVLDEVAAELGLPVEKIIEANRTAADTLSLDTPVGDEEDTSIGSFVEDERTPGPADATSNALLAEALKEILDTLTEREADVLRMRFGMYDGRTHTLEEVGQIFGVTRERIRQIENKAIRKLRHPSRAKKIKDFYC